MNKLSSKVNNFILVVLFAVCVRNFLKLSSVFSVSGLRQRVRVSGSKPGTGSDHRRTVSGPLLLLRRRVGRRKRRKLEFQHLRLRSNTILKTNYSLYYNSKCNCSLSLSSLSLNILKTLWRFFFFLVCF